MVWEIHCATEAIPVFSITRVLAYRLFFVSIYSLQSEVIEIQSGDMLESCLADTLPPLFAVFYNGSLPESLRLGTLTIRCTRKRWPCARAPIPVK